MKPYKIYERITKDNKLNLEESSWSRIIQHIESGHSFAVISAYVKEYPVEINLQNHEKLRRDIRKMGYGYIEQNSGFSYQNKRNNELDFQEEESFFIPLMKKDDALKLCKKYKQYSILFKDDSGFFELVSNGKIETEFKTKRESETGQITFNPQILKIAYSQLKKGSRHQRKQKFAYVVKECVWIEEFKIPTRYQGYREGKIPVTEFIRIL